MDEYIERGHLLAAFSLQDYPWVDVDDYYEIAQNIPADADVVKVVRCKDCKYQDVCEQMVEFTIRGLRVFSISHKVSFCSYGERKEE